MEIIDIKKAIIDLYVSETDLKIKEGIEKCWLMIDKLEKSEQEKKAKAWDEVITKGKPQ